MNALLRYKPLKQIYLFFFIGLLFVACGRNKKADVSNIPVNITVWRFDHDFDEMRTKPMAAQSVLLEKRYGIFYRDFVEHILKAGSTNDTAYFATLRKIFATKDYLSVKHEVDSVYPNLNKQNQELTDAFRRIKYYFPQKHIPQVYAYFSGFQAQTSIGDKYFAIGLDQFLGANSKFYPALVEEFPHYISRRFTPQNIVPRVVEGFVREDMFPEKDEDRTLLSKMIYNGKVMYMMDSTLPDVPDSVKIGYTPAQLQWCQDFKPQIWAYILDENLLYESDMLKIQKYINEAPFTPGLGEHNQSAPKIAVYTGWQIVKQYMDKNPQITLAQLMADNDAQKILNESKYRPK
ncbi:gliding motility-associated lipoprotein GldB [Mucilaginibacter gracilis]|uniref:Gliding motility-associated lipoprotein GldB n=1 Tax=Mucilaginibacter gracilis TaxID=423350 RepID=A0A495IYA2_9SPHI|nr:gliding motility lipoprotein GldB [Mucilaginibacter gracilis]RKR81685.1 gliding motility-associated lipoprotein GldB [Mucilaginibacter gracilis]